MKEDDRMKFISRLAAVLMAGFVLLQLPQPAAAKKVALESSDAIYKELDLVGDALVIVQSDYVEELDPKKLIYGALKGMLATLDPYSQFMDPDSYNELKVETE